MKNLARLFNSAILSILLLATLPLGAQTVSSLEATLRPDAHAHDGTRRATKKK